MLENSLQLLANAGLIDKSEFKKNSRKLFFDTNKELRLLMIRNTDILSYVLNNVADLAFIGSDTIMENGLADEYYDYMGLNFGKCKLMTAAAEHKKKNNDRIRIKVATKYVNIARNFYASKEIQADIIKVQGSVELAAITGLADEIVDIVDTGKTLQENNLFPLETIADVSMRLIINKGSFKRRWSDIDPVVANLSAAVTS